MKITKYIREIQKKPREVRAKVMWTLVVLSMLAITGIWWTNITSHKPNPRSLNQSLKLLNGKYNLDSLNLQKDIEELRYQKNEAFSKIKTEIDKKEVEEIVSDYIKENNVLEEKEMQNLKLKSIKQKGNIWYAYYEQYYKGIRVEGNYISFTVDSKEKKVTNYESNIDSRIKIDTRPKISEREAYNLIIENSDTKDPRLESAELVIYRDPNKELPRYTLAWKLTISSSASPFTHHYFLEADNGRIISVSDRQ